MSVDDYRDALPPATHLRGGEYVVEDVLGRGGFAVTYAARDTELARQTALKEFFPPGCGREGLRVTVPAPLQDEFARARDEFAREARALARFAHPHIVGVYATWSENETAYLALERIRGETLLARLERVGALPLDEVLTIAQQIGDALQTVHEAGLLHRDVTPGNIMLEPGEDALAMGRAVLLDFGLALESEAGTLNTRALTRARAVGTPAYAAPEQWGRRPKTPAVDVYAFAATLYHALSGVAPPPASDRAAGEELAPLAHADPQLEAWDDAIGRGMALSVAQRPPSVTDLVARLPQRDQLVLGGEVLPPAIRSGVPAATGMPAATVLVRPAPVAPLANVPHPGYESPRWAGALVGVAGRARGVAWSPDGQRVAVAADSHLLWVWEPNLARFERRARARTLAAHTDWLRSVAWSPDGQYLASAGADKTLCLWSSRFDYAPQSLWMNCEIAALDWQKPSQGALDPARGMTLGVGGSDGRARLLRLFGNELSREPQLLPGGSVPRYSTDEIWLRGIGWAEGGSRLWAGGDDGMLRAWQTVASGNGDAAQGTVPPSLQVATEFMAHPGGVQSLAVSPDGTQLATVGGYDTLVKLWDGEGRLLRTLPGARGPLLAVTWIAPDVVAAGGRDRAVRLWDTTTGAQLAILPEHPAEVCCLAFSPVSPYLCAGSEREVWIWRL